jgi:hypothetical protein
MIFISKQLLQGRCCIWSSLGQRCLETINPHENVTALPLLEWSQRPW